MRHYPSTFLCSIGLLGLTACTASRAQPDVAALLRQEKLQPGMSSRRQVVRVLGRQFRQNKHVLHAKTNDGGDITNRWTTLDYARSGIECTIVETTSGPQLFRLTLKPPYAGAVLDSVYLGRQTVGQRARALRRPVTSWAENRTLRPHEVQGYVSIDGLQLEARV